MGVHFSEYNLTKRSYLQFRTFKKMIIQENQLMLLINNPIFARLNRVPRAHAPMWYCHATDVRASSTLPRPATHLKTLSLPISLPHPTAYYCRHSHVVLLFFARSNLRANAFYVMPHQPITHHPDHAPVWKKRERESSVTSGASKCNISRVAGFPPYTSAISHQATYSHQHCQGLLHMWWCTARRISNCLLILLQLQLHFF